MKRIIIIGFLTTLSFSSFAQQVDYENNLGAWYMLFADAKVSNKLGVHAEVQPRLHKIANTSQQLLLRTSLDYFATENMKVSVGYGNITSWNYMKEWNGINPDEPIITSYSFNENRIYQELDKKQKRMFLFFIGH